METRGGTRKRSRTKGTDLSGRGIGPRGGKGSIAGGDTEVKDTIPNTIAVKQKR